MESFSFLFLLPPSMDYIEEKMLDNNEDITCKLKKDDEDLKN